MCECKHTGDRNGQPEEANGKCSKNAQTHESIIQGYMRGTRDRSNLRHEVVGLESTLIFPSRWRGQTLALVDLAS